MGAAELVEVAMSQYKVLRPIEHNRKLYLPETKTGPERVKSVGDGQEIPVDASGTIDLNEKEAQRLKDGRIETISESAGPGKQSKDAKNVRGSEVLTK
jgi:hypothetical protein